MRRRHIELGKTAAYAIAINALQILAALTVAILALVVGDTAFTGMLEQAALSGMALVVIWGATVDIREAFAARRLDRESDMLEDALAASTNSTARCAPSAMTS